MPYRPPSPYAPRRRPRLTRRGRLAVLAGALVALAVAAAVPLLLLLPHDEPATPPVPPSLLVPEGWRSAQVYEAVDRALALPDGTARTVASAPAAALGLPPEAAGNPEGYLFPATYPLPEGTTAEGLLRYMIATAGRRLGTPATAEAARAHGLTAHQALIVASIAQAEADTPEDMAKVARVVHNRLARGMPLQMDSTLNYALDRSTVDTTVEDTRNTSPYNTYAHQGLPPAPIGNPGEQAMAAALRPPAGDWLYFVTVTPGDTRFTADYATHQANVAEFNERRRQEVRKGGDREGSD
ncbi:endolytic transglycosylase MltG [Streptomyces sp. R302]|uniref:endolytic transglycosylase MltG n=1 Tax=unclassified Streptomyces TaxID=2593676 RepID=UPI00145D5E7C|nr:MULTISPECIES: endolytic transglycosylase MltG [unclassified Streptomyces]NML53847.1 endolytic transglycosylase MltG [Streptomyces sp. R301]NML83106.1 endolytic transglycosylase MltG [Streptomyces sp. R302]